MTPKKPSELRPKRVLSPEEAAILARLVAPSGFQRGPWFGAAMAFLAMMGASAIFFLVLGRNLDPSFQDALSDAPVVIASAVPDERALLKSCPAPTLQRPWDGKIVEMTPMLGSYLMQEYAKYQAMADFTECITHRHVERLCDTSRRKRLVADLKTYSQFHDGIVRMANSARRPAANNWEAIAIQSDPATLAAAIRQLDKVSDTDIDLMRRIRKLVQAGYLKPSDFGWFGYGVPAPIAPHLVLSEPAELPCQ